MRSPRKDITHLYYLRNMAESCTQVINSFQVFNVKLEIYYDDFVLQTTCCYTIYTIYIYGSLHVRPVS